MTAGETVDRPYLVSPVVRPGKMIAIGLNYMDHIRETGAKKPERPIAFAKYPSSINGPFDDIEIDDQLTRQADYEAELAVVNRPCCPPCRGVGSRFLRVRILRSK